MDPDRASSSTPTLSQAAADLGTDAALHLATLDVPIVDPASRADSILGQLRDTGYASIAEIPVCDDGILVGLLRVEDLVRAHPDTSAADLMDRDPPQVGPGLDRERAAWKAVHHAERSLAVVDAEGRFLGLILPHRLLAVVLEEHSEDLARLGGYLHDAEAGRTASSEPIQRRYLHRLPWLIVGLAGAMAAAELVGAFEQRLQEHLLIAFFVPGIVYLADAVGTQTEAIIIRGLSLGVSVRQVAAREIVTGILVGATLGMLLLPIVWLRWDDAEVAVAASIGLFLACAIANVVALSLPALLTRLRVDPAFGSGPIATVVQDLLSILIYFGVVTVIVD